MKELLQFFQLVKNFSIRRIMLLKRDKARQNKFIFVRIVSAE